MCYFIWKAQTLNNIIFVTTYEYYFQQYKMSKRIPETIIETINDHIYFNAGLFNNTDDSIPATISNSRTSPIVNKPSDYHLGVVRFIIPCNDIPIFIFQDNSYYVTLSYGGNNYSALCSYVGSNLLDATDRKIYAYSEFLQSINTALLTAYTNMKAANPAAPATSAPYLLWNPITGFFTMVAQKAGYDVNTVGTVPIWFNSLLFRFFPSFRVNYNGYANVDKRDFQIYVTDDGTNTSAGVISMLQQSTSAGSWNDIVSLIITSTLPTASEYITSPTNQTSAQNSTSKIITDFNVPVSTGGSVDPVSQIAYQYATTQPRLIELNSDQPITQVDLSVYWQAKDGTLYLHRLTPGEQLNIKVVFIKKVPSMQST